MRADDRDTPPQSKTVGFQVPAELDQLTMVHSLAETVLLVRGFALDEVTDLILALDEVATALMLVAAADTQLDCVFTTGDGTLGARIATVIRTPSALDEESFGWHVVATLTDALRIEYGDFDPVGDGYPATVEFGWIRRVHGPAAT
ncbi:anti-sigma factor [Nocardia rhizosphaerihabitans]|uniref:anti-sigma factor n=1 Tax=Nocardia rhizosphaerihabitans TaxID=1691570 RepID=UPI00366F219F